MVKCLMLEDTSRVSRTGVQRFLKCFNKRGTIDRKLGSWLPEKLLPQVQAILYRG